MSVRSRGSKWVATVWDTAENRKVWVGTFESKREAQDAERKAWGKARKRRRTTETCGSFAARWVDDYPRQKESTNINYRERIARFANHFGELPLNDLDRVEARAWAIRNRATFPAARAMFSDAVRDGLADTNPFTELRLEGSRGRKDLVVPTEEELAGLVLEARRIHGGYGKRVFSNMVQFAAYSGLRPGEVYGLRWGDIDFAGQALRVERQFNQKTLTFTTTKSGRGRTVFLTPQAAEAVKATARVRDEVFSAPQGGVFSGRVMSYYWRPVVNAVGRPDLTPHCLRHYFGTHLALLGLGPIEIAQALGHQDGGRLAMERYIHMSERDARGKIAAAFGSNVRDLRPVTGATGAEGGGQG